MDIKADDASEFVNDLLAKHLNTSIKPFSVKRIGKESKLVRISYNNSNEKDIVRKSLKLLKSAPPSFNSISITNDYTLEDQLIQKELRQKAVDLNSSDPSSIHQVNTITKRRIFG